MQVSPPPSIEEFGFIITRHVNSPTTNNYWNHCIRCIRKHYPYNKIVIVDDNSNYEFVKQIDSVDLSNCVFVQSEYHGRGELLGYYYLYKNKYFQKALIIHDSLFIHHPIDVSNIKDCKFLFHHETHLWDKDNDIIPCLHSLESSCDLLQKYHEKHNWYLCFGVLSVITVDFLEKLQQEYKFFNLLTCITDRDKRMGLERIFGFLCTLEKPSLKDEPSILGDIMNYYIWLYSYQEYVYDTQNGRYQRGGDLAKFEVVKVYTGR
jgi:hypothetical protein